MERTFMAELTNSDIKRYGEIRKLATVQNEGYTTGCLLNYECIKNYFKLIPLYLCKQKELDADPKANEQIEFAGKLKNTDGENVDGTQSMFVLAISEKNQRNTTKILLRKCKSLVKDGRL